VEEFWLWVNSWAVFLQRPSDLGFSDEGYELPADGRRVAVRRRARPRTPARSATGREAAPHRRARRDQARAEKRATLPARIAKVRALVEAEPDEHVIIWHDLEDERRAIEAAVPASSRLRRAGSRRARGRRSRLRDGAIARSPASR
jgi:hypothetical protein